MRSCPESSCVPHQIKSVAPVFCLAKAPGDTDSKCIGVVNHATDVDDQLF